MPARVFVVRALAGLVSALAEQRIKSSNPILRSFGILPPVDVNSDMMTVAEVLS
jgi:hypothetical protein